MNYWLYFNCYAVECNYSTVEWWDGEPDIYSNPHYIGAAISDQQPNFSISGECCKTDYR